MQLVNLVEAHSSVRCVATAHLPLPVLPERKGRDFAVEVNRSELQLARRGRDEHVLIFTVVCFVVAQYQNRFRRRRGLVVEADPHVVAASGRPESALLELLQKPTGRWRPLPTRREQGCYGGCYHGCSESSSNRKLQIGQNLESLDEVEAALP
jgi:hypothetical protein